MKLNDLTNYLNNKLLIVNETNNQFEENIYNNIKNHIINFQNNTKKQNVIAVALSGGCDSLSLTIALNNIGKQHNFSVLAIMINHNLRKESTNEIKKTIITLNKFKIKYIVKEWDGVYKKNLENEARINRYKLLLETCKEEKINIICIGHHIDDQIETFLLNLARGSGIDGLCAMPKENFINNIYIIRPMLNIKKQSCKDYLEMSKIEWCEDESNNDTSFKRNKIRFILNQIEDKNLLTERISKSVNFLQEIKLTLDFFLKIICEKIEEDSKKFEENLNKKNSSLSKKIKKTDNNFNQIVISKNVFVNYPDYIKKSILVFFIKKLSNQEYKPRLYQIENLLSSIIGDVEFKRTLSKCLIFSKKDLFIMKRI